MWSLVLYFVLVLLLTSALIGLSYILGQRHSGRGTGHPYESGIEPTGSARVRFDVKFYLVAMFFVIFDIEAVFIFAWAVSLKENGWAGFIEMAVFILILFAGLVYLWRLGGLETGTTVQKHSSAALRSGRRSSTY